LERSPRAPASSAAEAFAGFGDGFAFAGLAGFAAAFGCALPFPFVDFAVRTAPFYRTSLVDRK
jgi:hypothetical protein